MGRAATTRDSKGARGASLAGSPVATRAKSCMVCQPDPRFNHVAHLLVMHKSPEAPALARFRVAFGGVAVL